VRKGLAAIAAAGLLALPAAAAAFVPPQSERADAKRFARAWWAERGHTPACHRVGFRWRRLPRDIVAAVPDYKDGSSKCVIVFNSRIDWEWNQNWGGAYMWWRLCRVAIHEWGHLHGMPFEWPPFHSRNSNSVMNGSERAHSLGAWWYPHFPGCRYEGDDEDGDGNPDA
jgi:hypothetical protein